MEASSAPAAANGGDIPPSQTLYVQNLTEKVKKAPLKKALYVTFSPFGRVVDIVHCRSNPLRGQAWVVFGDTASATAAMAKMQSFPLYDKPMRLSYAKERSHAIEKLEGKYKPGMKRSAESRKAAEAAGGGGGKGSKRARTGDGPDDAAAGSSGSSSSSSSSSSSGALEGGGAPPPAPSLPSLSIPSKTLLVQGLPTTLAAEALTEMLRTLFGQYAGLAEVRVVAQRGLAFVEYASEAAAAPALQGLMNFKLDAATTLVVSYAKAY